MKNNPLIVALDVETFDEARKLVDQLASEVDVFKIGSQLFTACGPVIVRHVLAKGKNVFLDLKFHDIPNTVANAVKSAVNLSVAVNQPIASNDYGHVAMLTVHIVGGAEMLEAAAKSAAETAKQLKVAKVLVLGVTVLTSEVAKSETVLERAKLAKKSGLDGVIASSHEVAVLRRELGKEFVIVTPGIRPKGSDVGDQKRVDTPKDAMKNGSNFLVVGRPIVKAASPLSAAQSILEEIR